MKVPQQTYGTTCYATLQCLTSLSLWCQSGLCSCPSSYIWDGSLCKASYGVACTATSQCSTPGSLSCKSGVCDCPLPTTSLM